MAEFCLLQRGKWCLEGISEAADLYSNIRSITLTETFHVEDKIELTAEQMAEVQQLREDLKLQRRNPGAFEAKRVQAANVQSLARCPQNASMLSGAYSGPYVAPAAVSQTFDVDSKPGSGLTHRPEIFPVQANPSPAPRTYFPIVGSVTDASNQDTLVTEQRAVWITNPVPVTRATNLANGHKPTATSTLATSVTGEPRLDAAVPNQISSKNRVLDSVSQPATQQSADNITKTANGPIVSKFRNWMGSLISPNTSQPTAPLKAAARDRPSESGGSATTNGVQPSLPSMSVPADHYDNRERVASSHSELNESTPGTSMDSDVNANLKRKRSTPVSTGPTFASKFASLNDAFNSGSNNGPKRQKSATPKS